MADIIVLDKISYPDTYDTNYIRTYPSFNEELEELIQKSGYLEEFKIKYYKALKFLENLKRNCVMQSRLFEELKGSESLYSMKLKGKKNIRILFDFQVFENRDVAVLYNCFQEKRTKDYTANIKEAQKRKKELFESE